MHETFQSAAHGSTWSVHANVQQWNLHESWIFQWRISLRAMDEIFELGCVFGFYVVCWRNNWIFSSASFIRFSEQEKRFCELIVENQTKIDRVLFSVFFKHSYCCFCDFSHHPTEFNLHRVFG